MTRVLAFVAGAVAGWCVTSLLIVAWSMIHAQDETR